MNLEQLPEKEVKKLDGFKLLPHPLIYDDKSYYSEETGQTIIVRKNKQNIVLEEDNILANGYIDLVQDGYGFLRDISLRPTKNDVYVSANMIKLFGLAEGDHVLGIAKEQEEGKFPNLIFLIEKNERSVKEAFEKTKFESLTPTYPLERLKIEENLDETNRLISLISPIGKGQRGLIVAPPKAGKTTVLKRLAKSLNELKDPVDLMVVLIDERPEEVTEIEEIVKGHVISSTFDQRPEDHVHMAEFAIEIAKKKVENGRHVVLLLDSITRLARAYNIVVPSSGKILSGGFDPHALYKPKKFFGAARNTKEAGSLTIIATALVETGSRMDEFIYEEFKGTGNMEMHLDREIAEKRIFPAVNINKSSTRRDELLYTKEEKELIDFLRTKLDKLNDIEAARTALTLIKSTEDNLELLKKIKDKK